MNDTICSNNNSTQPAAPGSYNDDFRRICEGLAMASTLAEAELCLMYALAFTDQISPGMKRVSFTATSVKLHGSGGVLASPWAEAAWSGFSRMLQQGRLQIASAEVVPVVSSRGLLCGASLQKFSTDPPRSVRPMHYYLEAYMEEITERLGRVRELRRFAARRGPVW